MADYPRPSAARPHILVVNGRKVRNPVFVIGAPRAGTEMLARAFKRSPGFHMTLGQRWVLPVVQAFARTPSLARGHPEAAATVLRDAFAPYVHGDVARFTASCWTIAAQAPR